MRYLRCEHEATRHHPLLRGLEDAQRIIHGVSRIELLSANNRGHAAHPYPKLSRSADGKGFSAV